MINQKLEKQQFTHKNDLGFDFLINAMVMKFQGAESAVCIQSAIQNTFKGSNIEVIQIKKKDK